MKVICDYCSKKDHGTVDELIDKGWNRTIIRMPNRVTITCCESNGCSKLMTDGIKYWLEKKR